MPVPEVAAAERMLPDVAVEADNEVVLVSKVWSQPLEYTYGYRYPIDGFCPGHTGRRRKLLKD